jgi:uncharacterized RDD family membrane protein YckC
VGAVKTRNVAVGIVVAGARAGAAAGRLALWPVRVASRAPVVGGALRGVGEGLNDQGEQALASGRHQLEERADDLLAAPEVERTVDQALAGPLTDAVARSLAEHRVIERLAAEVLASPDLEDAVARALEHEQTERVAGRALASPGLERLVVETLESRLADEVTDRVLKSPELERIVEHVASSPQVRTALVRQTSSFADEVAAGLRRRAAALDDSAERAVHRRRPRAERADVPYAGLVSRAAGFLVDVVLVHALYLTGGALLGLAASLVGELRPEWLVVTLAAVSWAVVVGSYFTLFWTVTGQTPGMRVLGVRVYAPNGEPPRFGRAVVRLVGLLLAIVPLFAGFVPVLFDRRRRGLPDMLAGTVVTSVDRTPRPVEQAAALEAGSAPA